MTVARVRCHGCGQFTRIECAEVRVGLGPSTYGFDCPRCGFESISRVPPGALDEALRCGALPPISGLDLEAFRAELARL